MTTSATWGVVSTIKAPADEIIQFAAYHLDLGAAQITVCLDNDNPAARQALEAHPKCHVIRTDRAYWQDLCGYRPKKHQFRQAMNASHTYAQSQGLDWLAHIDVDEFLCPDRDIGQSLAALPADLQVARVSPCESLCLEDQPHVDPRLTYCKGRPAPEQSSRELERDLYPEFGGFFRDGFISHTVGKIFVRTGLEDLHFGIHRGLDSNKQQIPDQILRDVELCHRHVESWDKWQSIMEFRLTSGSYRPELGQNVNPASGRMSKHALFTALQEEGPEGLRGFFEETCLATPRLLDRLSAHGLLRKYALELSPKVEKHFPGFLL